MRKSLPLLGAIFLLAAAGCARPQSSPAPQSATPLAGAGGNWDAVVFIYDGLPLSGEGPFVGVPAAAGGGLFFVPGFIVGFPLAVFTLPFGTHAAASTPFYVGVGFGAVGYGVFGAPFWIVKSVVWDAPCAFGRFLSLACRSPKGRADYLAGRMPRWDDSLQAAAGRKLERLTGEKPRLAEDWPGWWQRHRDEFDKNMRRIKPPAPPPERR